MKLINYQTFKKLATGEYVYKTLRKNIVNLVLKPGDKLSEKEVADYLKVSRTPVRESFIKLAKEGVINVLPQRGSFVAKIDLDIADEARFIRSNLELAVLKDLISSVNLDTSTLFLELKHNLKLQEKFLKDKDYENFLDIDDQFHQLLYKYTAKEFTWNFINQSNIQYNRIRMLANKTNNLDLETNYQEHIQLVKAIESSNYIEASEILKKHLNKIESDRKSIIKAYPNYFKSK